MKKKDARAGGEKGLLRIIAGEWRGRKLKFSAQLSLRPTPDRVRETLFNWLQYDVPVSRCLDLYAGSGALGFEAASRGATQVTMVESNRAVCTDLQANMQTLNARQIELVAQDAITFLQHTDRQLNDAQFDLVFLDPPYQSDLLQLSVSLLEQQHWLANHAKIYVETNSKQLVDEQLLPDSWQRIKSSSSGQVAFSLYQRSE